MIAEGVRVLVTGANGFVGRGLGAALRAAGCELVLADRQRGAEAGQWMTGDLDDPDHLQALAATRPGVIYHLASVPGALAEADPRAGWAANLLAPQALFAAIAAGGTRPRLVFASSIAVLGPLRMPAVTEDVRPAPTLSYGAHKWMTEILLADLSRRGEIDGISLRLPGIVARPQTGSGHGSAFMSEIFHHAASRTGYRLPVSLDATCWWMSRSTLVANLLHAASLDGAGLPASRTVQLPVLTASVGSVLEALEAYHGAGAAAGIRSNPDERIEALFGRLPACETPRSRALGFVSDADPAALVAAVAHDA
jgi:nucleoside-diphosphate-sugar epimerase